MDPISDTRQERHRRKMALQLNIQRIREGMRAAEDRRQQERRIKRSQLSTGSSRRRHSSSSGAQHRVSSPDDGGIDTTPGSPRSRSRRRTARSDLLNTARIDLSIDDGEATQQAYNERIQRGTSSRRERRERDCRCHDRRIRRRLEEAQTAILEEQLISYVIGTRMTWYYLYANLLLEFWNQEQAVAEVEQRNTTRDVSAMLALKTALIDQRTTSGQSRTKSSKKDKGKKSDSDKGKKDPA